MKKEMMENATGVKVTKKASKNVIRSLSVGLAAMMALSTPIATFAEDVDAQNGDGETPEESTTSVSTQKPAAEQVKDIQDGSAKTAAESTTEAKEAVDNAVDTARNDNSGADQEIRDAAGVLDSVANGSVESGTKGNVAESAVENTIAQIEKAEEAAEKTDAALDKANEKAEEANTIADDAAKEQQEAKDALDEATGKIESATTVDEAQNAYNEVTGIVGDAQAAYETAKAAYDSKVAEYNAALDELKAAQEAYDAAVASASTEVAEASANLAAVQQKAEELQQAAEAAKAAIPELTDAQKAALEIIKQENERAGDTSTNWRKEDELFKVILQNYYMPELIRGELVDCKWVWDKGNADKNYCEVTYTDVAGDPHTVYLNYRINDKGDDIVIFEKNDEVVSYDVKSADGKLAFNIDAKNFPLGDLENDQDTATYEKDGVTYTIVNVNGTYYVAGSETTHMGTALKYTDDSKYVASGEKTTIYSVDDNGNLIQTVKQNVSEITYTGKTLSSDKTYDNVKDAEKELADEKAALAEKGDKDFETSMSATATANVEVSQKTTFTTVIDLSKIIVEMKAIKYDNDKYEKKNAEIAAHELFDKFTNIDALQELLGEDYVIESINQDNAKVNDTKQYKNTSKRWTDSFADSAAYTNVFSGTIVIKYSRTMTANGTGEKSKTNEVNATDNSNLEELKGQAFDEAQKKATAGLVDATSQNKKITDNLKTGELHINGYKNSFGKTDSNVTIKMRYDNGAFIEGAKQTEDALVVEKNSSSNLSVSYTGTYQEKGFNDLGEQAVDMQKYKETAKAEEVKDHTGNSYYDDYKKTGKINEGIWLTGKNDDHFTSDENFKNFKDFKDAALKANAEKTEKEAKADAIIGAAKAAVDAVTKAKADVETLQSQLTGLLASQNYTAAQVKELEGQISAAEAKLKEAEEKASSLTDDLEIAEKTLADKIADLTPAPAPVPDGNGSTTNPTGGETTPAGTPTGTATTPTVSTTTAVVAETALADAAPIEIAETPVALAATAPTAVATAARTSVAANANTDANADDNVVIEDEETPLADNGAQDEETTSITDEATPLAAEAGAMETMKQEKMSWWWLLIIALLGVTGEEMYRRNKKKKAEVAEKNEK